MSHPPGSRVDELPFVEGIALAVRAGRHRLGLSQRAFAERTGLSKSAVARVESAHVGVLAQTVAAALAGVSLRLCVADDDDRVWDPEEWALDVDQEDARDAAGRRLPAHLRAYTCDPEPYWRYLRRRRRAESENQSTRSLRDRTLTYESAAAARRRRLIEELSP
jgi:transcriptional regulator with XRE-family HTH domain